MKPPVAQNTPKIAAVTEEDMELGDDIDRAFDRKVFHRSCYLAGPMRGIEEYNFPAFDRAELDLTSRGWRVFNPAKLGAEQGDDPRQYLAQELPLICLDMDAIICLPGWEDSKGANLEVHCARVCGVDVLAYGEDGELSEIPVAAPPALLDGHDIDVYIEELHGLPDHAPEESHFPILTKKIEPETVCQEADRLVSYDRNDDYGHPLDDFTKVVEAARALGIDPVKNGAEHHALYMVLVKLARETNKPKRDNRVDACGYLKTEDMVIEERERRAQVD